MSPRFEVALQFAATRHADHVRKGTRVPYVAHLLGVASIVLEHGGNEQEAIAALLHDAIEDGKATGEEIRERFGTEVAAIVAGCSDSLTQPKPPWRKRKIAYLEHIAAAPRSVQLVSNSDKLHNARSLLADYERLGEALWDRFNGGREGTLWYYRGIVDVLAQGGESAVVTELRRTVERIEELAANG